MATITVIRSIQAPAEIVFQTVADPRRFAQVIAGVTQVELLSETTSGAGTRFRQSRVMNGKETTMDFEVTEYVENQRIRIVNETHGTVWDSLFTLDSSNTSTRLTMRMETRSRRLLPRLLMPLVCLFVKKAVEKDIDAVKAYCEPRES